MPTQHVICPFYVKLFPPKYVKYKTFLNFERPKTNYFFTMKKIILSILLLSFAVAVMGQAKKDTDVVQVSGIVMTSDSLGAVSYATIAVKGTSRGTYANYEGFFSIVARKGETLQFTSIGFEQKEYIIPEDYAGSRLTLVQLLTADAYNLPETVIFPWPSREHLKLEFLALEVTKDLEDRAKENLDQRQLAAIGETMAMDGNENSDLYLRHQAQKFYHYGQAPPMQIFNAFAWAKFIKAWKNGDFKKKKDDRN